MKVISFKKYSFFKVFAFSFFIALLVSGTVFILSQNLYIKNLIKLSLEITELMSQQQISIFLSRNSIVHLEDILSNLVKATPIKYAYIVNDNNNIIAASDNRLPTDIPCCYKWEEMAEKRSLKSDKNIYNLKIDRKDVLPQVPEKFIKDNEILTKGIVAINDHSFGNKIGSLVVLISTNKKSELIHSMAYEYSLSAFLITILTGLLVSYFIAGYLSKPIEKAIKDLNRIKWDEKINNIDEFFLNTNIREINIFGDTIKKSYKMIIAVKDELYKNKLDGLVAQRMQMIAHDIRKPFSMLLGVLDFFELSEDPQKIRESAKDFIPIVRRSITETNGMLEDIMELGRTAKPFLEPTKPESIIESSLTDVARIHNEAQIEIKYFFNHSSLVNVDPLKIGRVFSNIIENAFQAIDSKGQIWFSTQEQKKLIRFSIGNKGSHIPKEDIPYLFKSFYTKNKASGTGLGLAISHKIITAHNGKIWCESSEKSKTVEFFFTLPVIKETSKFDRKSLPKDTNEITEKVKTAINDKKHDFNSIVDPKESEFEENILRLFNEQKRQFKIALIDDEEIYRNALKNLVDKSESLRAIIDIKLYHCSKSALKGISSDAPDFIICDVDLGKGSISGFQIVQNLRKDGCKIPICIHSNRSLTEDYIHSVKVGANAFLPKPMTKSHLLKFMIENV